MTIKTAMLAPPYSIIVIDDPTNKDVPQWVDGPVVTGTESCLFVSCMAEVDGETEFTLGKMKEISPGTHLVYHGVLNTPNSRIVLGTVEGDSILEAPTQGHRTRIWIWANSTKRPDKVIVGLE